MPETTADEQELAKVLHGVVDVNNGSASVPVANDNVHTSGLSPITPSDSPAVPPQPSTADQTVVPLHDSTKVVQPLDAQNSPEENKVDNGVVSEVELNNVENAVVNDSSDAENNAPVAPVPDESTPPAVVNNTDDVEPSPAPAGGPLDSIKNDALNELRPLVDKLDLKSEEKFDTYLLLIRSTDDMNLIAPAHEAAKAIEDETRRAQALLDIIKEIDYLSHQKNKQ